jgi:hypothetical protein
MLRPSPRAATYGLAALFALALMSDLLWMPIQVGDSLGELIEAQRSPSVWASFESALGSNGYLRPLRIAQIKALSDLAQDSNYWLVFRGFHALLLGVAVFLFTRVLRVSTSTDFAAAAFALVTLTGLHTFRGTVQEAFPINHFLEILVCCLLTLNLARSRGGIWVDATAAIVFSAAALTLESGLLVWVVACAAWTVGWRGISIRGLALMTVLLLGYMYLRFVFVPNGMPTLLERSSGFWLTVLDPTELQQRFGSRPLGFYSYNVATSVMSVLFSEPQAGVFEAVRAWLDDRVLPRVVVPVVTSAITTGLILWATTRRAVNRQALDDTARFIIVGMAVIGANAALSFSYTKNDILSIAGAFYALAAYGAIRDGLLTAPAMQRTARIAFTVLLCVLSVGWTIRSAGGHYLLRLQAFRHQADWTVLPGLRQRNGQWPSDLAEQRLIHQLRGDAVGLVLPNTRVGDPQWPVQIWPD